MDYDDGRIAAQRLWREGLSAGPVADPLTTEFAKDALDELERLQKGTPGILKDVLDGAQISAEQLNVDEFHGIQEVVQNADDLAAREVRVAIQKRGRHSTLLIAHNGNRVHLDHVIAMALAFVSTKRADAKAKGRFGIGLKTLGRLGTKLTVHCHPYDFTINASNISKAAPVRSIASFYDSPSTHTLLELALAPGFDESAFLAWFSELGASALLFLDTVKSLRLLELPSGRELVHHRLVTRAQHDISLPTLSETVRCTELRDPKRRQSWLRYEVERKVPSTLKRRNKAIGESTPVAIAIPLKKEEAGQLYAGLPLGVEMQLPFSINAQFDPDTARHGIQHDKLNEWLIRRVAELAAAIALHLAVHEPTFVWRAVALRSEQDVSGDEWVSSQIANLVTTTQAKLGKLLTISIDGSQKRLRDIVYEVERIDQLIGQAEVDGLKPNLDLTLLPSRYRDQQGRWRLVLSELEGPIEISVSDAITLFDWEADDLAHRDVDWFMKLAHAALDENLGDTIWLQKSIVISDGSRIVPPMPHHEGEVLTTAEHGDSLIFRLGLAHAIHPAYLLSSAEATAVRRWLKDNDMLLEIPDAESTLRALAVRRDQEQPFVLTDQDVRDLRDMLEAVPVALADELGPRIGRAVAVNANRWHKGKKVRSRVRPAETYMPASIEDRKDGWAKAASKTPNINWLDPRYRKVLQRKRNRRRSATETHSLGTHGLFKLLGVENTPRLVESADFETRYGDPASPIDWQKLSSSQREQLNDLQRHATHLKRDYSSPDLASVLRDLRRERRARGRRERTRALISTLEREWTRLYARNLTTNAVYSDHTWQRAGTISQTWIASAKDEPWLRNEAGKQIAPRVTAVRTKGTAAIHGNDRQRFARDLEESDATSPVIRALGIETDPQVTELVAQLAEIRAQHDTPSNYDLDLRYAAIAAYCRHRNPLPDTLVGDLTVRQLRARFGTRRSKEGLIYSRGCWLPPSRVYLGTSIFGQRRPFVSENAAAALWHTLNIRPPTVADSLDVLHEVATEQQDNVDDELLVNAYQYLDRRLADVSAKELAMLKDLPLWTGNAWRTDRPVYLPLVRDIEADLSRYLPVWRPPLVPGVVPNLVNAIDVTLLEASHFTPVARADSLCVDTQFNDRFESAVTLLEDWLARHDPTLARCLSVRWETLAKAHLFCDADLQIELAITKADPVRVRCRVHVSRSPLTFYCTDAEALGEDDVGGQAVASLFTDGDRDKLALAWSRCWSRAGAGDTGAVRIVEHTADADSLESLFDQASSRTSSRPSSRTDRRAEAPRNSRSKASPREPEVRRLKSLDQFPHKIVDLQKSDGTGRATSTSKRSGLRKQTPSGRSISAGGSPASKSAPLAYSEREKEDLALHVLQLAIDGEASGLQDYRHLRGIGADALDKLKRYFEIKAYYGSMPNEITLTANEAERAFIEKDKFFLAVVSGLEQGYETTVRIVPNPLQNLKPKSNSSVTLCGVTSSKFAIEIRFAEREASEADV